MRLFTDRATAFLEEMRAILDDKQRPDLDALLAPVLDRTSTAVTRGAVDAPTLTAIVDDLAYITTLLKGGAIT
ncbi:hypothetical protein COO58_17590 [Micromonospora sp. WMMA1996]|uniref:hypothetical protein n=1 Tax=Micromonospora sp. WMMA1996 TaxID=2039878 RepID=UPI000BF914A4|nr:hypothetical protein [Micromonospora sp. WMMA1996]PGH46021.1 hypothetical protein COO58_17590 [Micromonospora sp. WMMA1996]